MELILQDIGRRFNRHWIFRHVDVNLKTGHSYAILGPNGAGKSTLLQVLMGSLSPSEGTVRILDDNGKPLPCEQLYQFVSLAAPYQELIEELTLSELLDFHFSFKRYLPGWDRDRFIELLALPTGLDKEIRYFSSGMKQRTKLALACVSDTPLLMLDEPTSNLDVQGVDWYRKLIDRFAPNRLLLICSNQPHEYDFCGQQIDLLKYK